MSCQVYSEHELKQQAEDEVIRLKKEVNEVKNDLCSFWKHLYIHLVSEKGLAGTVELTFLGFMIKR